MLLDRFPDFTTMRVLDLGGTLETWASAPTIPKEVVLLNPDAEDQLAGFEDPTGGRIQAITGDGCAPPAALAAERFDLVYSNSTLEHLGGYERRLGFASTVLGSAAHHWVQTPYRYFPIEPHWMFPGFQFLPVAARAEISRRWPMGQIYRSPPEPRSAAVHDVLEVELISATEMRYLFPGSEIVKERFAGLVKSLIAIR